MDKVHLYTIMLCVLLCKKNFFLKHEKCISNWLRLTSFDYDRGVGGKTGQKRAKQTKRLYSLFEKIHKDIVFSRLFLNYIGDCHSMLDFSLASQNYS